MKKINSTAVILLILPFLVKSQNNTVLDWNKWNDNKLHDTIRLDALNRIIENELLFTNSDSACKLNDIAIKLAQSKNYKKQLGDCYLAYSILYQNKSEFDSAKYFVNKALGEYLTINKFSRIAAAYNQTGTIECNQGNFARGISNFIKCRNYKMKQKDTLSVSKVTLNIGKVFADIGNQKEALSYYFDAFNQIKNTHINKDLDFTAYLYGNIATSYLALNKPKKALFYYKKQNTYLNGANDSIGLALYYNNIGACYSHLNNFDSSIIYFFKSINLSQRLNFVDNIALNYHNIADAKFNKKEFSEALSYELRAKKIADSLGIVNEDVIKINFGLYNIYKHFNETSKALIHLEQYIQLKDSLNNPVNSNSINKQILKYEFEQERLFFENANLIKDKKITSSKLIIVLLIVLIILSSIIIYLVIQHRKILSYKKEKKLKQTNLGLQMNPHFIFNAINSIQEYILSDENEKAHHYLSEFSKLIRLFLVNNRSQSISMFKEIEFLKIYISLEEQRLKSTINFIIINNENLNLDELLIPPMLLQPLIENSIWHGIRTNDVKNISIVINQVNNNLHINLIDNGIGLKDINKEKSLGLNITKNRVKLLYNKEPSFEYVSIKNNTDGGVVVKLILPIVMNTD